MRGAAPAQPPPVARGPGARGPVTRGPATRGPGTRGPPGPPATFGSADLVPCKVCGRTFTPDRIAVHTNVCVKTSQRRKRRPFDSAKHRAQGTEMEPYLKRGRPKTPPAPPKSNWRKKHEEFVAAVRAARQAQAHLAKGGKLADLPPPPPSDTSDLIPCPHCHRKFNEAAAARHIPRCATYEHNKPKPGTVKPATVKGRTAGAKY